jgi:hypothetical protein
LIQNTLELKLNKFCHEVVRDNQALENK